MDEDPARLDPLAAPPGIDKIVDDTAREPGLSGDHWPQSISLLEETAVVSKRRVVTGSVKIGTRTELRQESADLELDRHVVDVTRVPIDRMIEEAPEVRTEGDTTIIPVLEERYVVVKQVFLKEELHIRHRRERETFRQPVALRRQVAVVERFDPEGRIIGPGEESAPRSPFASIHRVDHEAPTPEAIPNGTKDADDDRVARGRDAADPQVDRTIVDAEKGEKPWTS